MEADMNKAAKNYEKKERFEAAENIRNTIGEIVDKLRNGSRRRKQLYRLP